MIYARFATIILEKPGRSEAVIGFTKLLGQEIRVSIFKMTREWLKLIK